MTNRVIFYCPKCKMNYKYRGLLTPEWSDWKWVERCSECNTVSKVVKYTEKQYKQYCEFYSIIANGDVFEGADAHFGIEDWIKRENISQDVIKQMDKRMEQECEEEMGNAKEDT